MTRNDQLDFRTRMIPVLFLAPPLLIAAFIALNTSFVSNPTIHWISQLICGFLLAGCGSVILRSGTVEQRNAVMVLGWGLLCTAVVDLCYAVIVFPGFQSASQSMLMPWGWLGSRLVMAATFSLSSLVWLVQRNFGVASRAEIAVVCGLLSCASIALCLFMIFPPQTFPTAYSASGYISRPYEFVAAVVFAVALLGVISAGEWRHNIFTYCFLLALGVSVITHTLLMPFAQQNFDHFFAAAVLTKIYSYGLILFGLVLRARENMQQAAEDQQVRHRAIVEAASEGIITFDTDGIIDTFNPAAARLFGYTEKEVLGQNVNMLTVSDFSELSGEYQQQNDSVAHSYEAVGQTKAGDEIQLECSISEIEATHKNLFTVIVRDVTERKARQEKLEDVSQRLAIALASAGQGSWEQDLQQSSIVWDRQMFQLYGLEDHPGEPTHELWLQHTHPEDREPCLIALQQTIETGRPVDMELRIVRPDGSMRWIKTHGKLVKSETGQPLRIVGINRDITKRKLHELELEVARAEADKANRAKSDFLANMSHEIRTPLNGVISMAEVLGNTKLEDYQLDMTKIIGSSANSLLEIIEDVLDFSKIEAGKLEIDPTVIDVPSVIEDVCARLRCMALERNVELTVSCAPEIPGSLVGDGLRLRQVVTNLINNAIKFSGNQDDIPGEVAVDVGVSASDGDQLTLEFRVTDNGIGMDEDTVQHLFSAFTQADASTSRKFGGTGLGLAISQRLTDLMNGEIKVQSKPGEGATFTARLPFFIPACSLVSQEPEIENQGIAASAAVSSQPRPVKNRADVIAPSREEALAQGRLILVAEDNETNQKVIKGQLSMLGYAADIVQNGHEALQLWREGQYALLITDLEMPELDGLKLVAAIRAEEQPSARMPVAALTANVMPGQEEKCKAAGMDAYLSKPATLKDIEALLETWLPIADGQAGTADSTKAQAAADSSVTEIGPPIDVAVLSELVGGNLEMVNEYLRDFPADAAPLAANLRAACEQGEVQSATAAAHKLRSSALTVGAVGLGEVCASLENAGKTGSVEKLGELLGTFEQELIAVEEYIENLVAA